MGEEETKTEVPEATENGTTSLSEKPAEAVAEGKEVKEDIGVKEMGEDNKDDVQVETEKMDEDSEVKENKEMKEEEERKEEKETKEEKENEEDKEKEESKTEAMGEENGSNEKEVADEKEVNKEDEEEKSDEAEDDVQKEEETKKGKGSAKRAKRKSGEEKVREKKAEIVEEKKEPEPRTPAVDRPVRERKSVERLVATIEKVSSRELHIEKGRGTPLKDIPNVAFKLSRRKTDDTFRLLHSILFGRRGKAFQIKSNISRFSGFVWHENEEKQRIKVKEKIDKCNKEKLLEFCDVLDIPISKTTMRKEDVVTSLIDFLLAPHATTNVLLAEKESNKSNKRKRVSKGSSTSGSTSSKHSSKSQRKTEGASKRGKNSTLDTDDESEEEQEEQEEEEEEEEKEEEKEESEDEEKENGVPKKSDEEMPEQSESEDKDESEDDYEEEVVKRKRTSKASSTQKKSGGKSRTKKITVSTKSSPPPKRTPKKASAKRTKDDEVSDATPKVFSRKKKNEKVTKEKTSTPTKSTPKEKPGEKTAKGKEKDKEEKLKLTDEKLRVAICEILKEVDFNTATFTDILKQLAKRFDTDLTSRKSSIKLMIQEELTKIADEDGEGDAEKDETQAAGQEVEA